ncbi:MAG: hypothetical protein Q9168_001085 [Polycauliona sp. 1 TL-2023]
MPIAHIGLTVSHLPTSCSFFLAALAPLGYRYCGQSGSHIVFGADHAELFISQETASIKATSAHIAFLVLSRDVVDSFFSAALRAGGRSHGEPTERDPASGYYSAAVLDFDDNSIEVMHRGGKGPNAQGSDHGLEADRVLSWQREVAASTVGQASRFSRASPRVIVTNITKPTIMVLDQTASAKAGSDQNSRTLIGTLLGAAAGAAVAYAMSKGGEASNQSSVKTTFHAIEAARSQLAPSAINTRMSHLPTTISSHSRREPAMTECSQSRLFSSGGPANRLSIAAPPTPAAQASTLIDTLAAPSEVPRYGDYPVSRSQVDRADSSSRRSRRSAHTRSRTSLSRSHSSAKIKTRADAVDSRQSSVITEFRQRIQGSLPPLPSSTASSGKSRLERDLKDSGMDEGRGTADDGTVLESVAPSDSISQAGSKKSKGSTRAGQSSRASTKGREEDGSRVSEATIRAEKSKARSGKRSMMSLPVKPSSRTSVHRSVVSFLPGM